LWFEVFLVKIEMERVDEKVLETGVTRKWWSEVRRTF